MMATDDYMRAVDLRPLSGSRLPAGRDVNHDELTAVLATCQGDERAAGIRDAAVIALAYLSGTRRAELAALHLADVEADPPAVRVIGKGGKQRLVPLSPTVGPFLDASYALRGTTPGPLFCPIDRAGNLRLGRGLTGEAIRQLLGRRSQAAGVETMSPHDLRRSYAGDLLDAGADLPADPAAPRPRLTRHHLTVRPTRRQSPPGRRRAPHPRGHHRFRGARGAPGPRAMATRSCRPRPRASAAT